MLLSLGIVACSDDQARVVNAACFLQCPAGKYGLIKLLRSLIRPPLYEIKASIAVDDISENPTTSPRPFIPTGKLPLYVGLRTPRSAIVPPVYRKAWLPLPLNKLPVPEVPAH